MWTRKILKTNAKDALKRRYWLAFLVSILAVILITGSLLGSGTARNNTFDSSFSANIEEKSSQVESVFNGAFSIENIDFNFHNTDLIILLFAIMSIISFFAIVFMITYYTFISNPIIVGHKKFYLDNHQGKAEAGKLLSSFGTDYKNIVKVMFFKNLRVFLWSLLLIVPGIIKAIEYMAVDYLLAEYPKMTLNRALKLSSEITKGQKWDIFKLGLSFLGWVILCIITAGIGFVFLNPYIQATFAELYATLIERPMTENMFAPDELTELAETE